MEKNIYIFKYRDFGNTDKQYIYIYIYIYIYVLFHATMAISHVRNSESYPYKIVKQMNQVPLCLFTPVLRGWFYFFVRGKGGRGAGAALTRLWPKKKGIHATIVWRVSNLSKRTVFCSRIWYYRNYIWFMIFKLCPKYHPAPLYLSPLPNYPHPPFISLLYCRM
jgi:hypothetical protein